MSAVTEEEVVEERTRTEAPFPAAELGLPGILRRPYLEAKTGLLHFVHGDERLSLRYVNGQVVSALSSCERWRLGESLVRRGLLERSELERALDVAGREGRRLGPVLRELGLLRAATAEDAVAGQVRDVLAEIASWPDAVWSFEPQEPPVPSPEDLTLELPTADLIVEAVRRLPSHAVLRSLGDLDRRLVPSEDPWARSQRISLSPAAAYLLSRVDGRLTARQVLEISPLDEAEGLRTLLGLLCSGTIVFSPAARSGPVGAEAVPQAFRAEVRAAFAGLRTRTPHEILGVPAAATGDDVRSAYVRLAKRFHPDVLHDPVLADLRDELHTVFVRIGEAYNQLRSAPVGARPTRAPQEGGTEAAPASGAPAPARSAPAVVASPGCAPAPEPGAADVPPATDPGDTLRAAERHFAAGRYWDAIVLAEPLARSAGGAARRRARLLLARAYAKNPKWVHDAESELQALVREDPQDAEAWQELGDIYRERGLDQRAASMYRKVLQLRPGAPAASSRLRSPDTAARLVSRLLRRAEAAGAELLSGSRS